MDTVKVGIFLLYGLAGILLWGPGCLLSSQGHAHSQEARVFLACAGSCLWGMHSHKAPLHSGRP